METKRTPKNNIRQNPREAEFVQNPYTLYDKLHRSGKPAYWQEYGFWCLHSFSEVNSALRDRRFARLPPSTHKLPGYAPHLADFAEIEQFSLLALEGETHTRLRKAINRPFASSQLSSLANDIKKIAHQALDKIEAFGRADVLATYATPIPVTVITRMLGVPESAGDQLIDWSHAMVRVYTLTQSHEDELTANRAALEFSDFVLILINEKRQQPSNDLISQLLFNDHGGSPLSDAQIISLVVLLLNAGHEATVHQLGNAVLTLLKHYPLNQRESLMELLASDDTADQLVAECLRFDAPLHLFTRFAQEDMVLDSGVTLQAGDQLGLLLAAANRCPLRFNNADQFIPLRNDAGQLSLGAGNHFCVGAHLAKMELRIALQVLFERFPEMQLCNAAIYQDSYHFHGLQSLEVNW